MGNRGEDEKSANPLVTLIVVTVSIAGGGACAEEPGGESGGGGAILAQAQVPVAPERVVRRPGEVRAAPEVVEGPALRPAPGAPAPAGPRYGEAEVTATLEGAMVEIAGVDEGPRLAQVAKRVLVWWIDLRRDLRRGDRIGLVYEPVPDEEPRVHALWFESEKLGAERTALRFQASGARFPRWYETNGTEVAETLVPSPIEEYEQITSLLRDGRGHRGVDFKAPVGTPILAPFDGVVRRRNWSTRRNGYCLELVDRRRGLTAYFLHLDEIPGHVRPGRRVKTGEVIAKSGNTGRSTAPHLHYQLERGGKVLDPFRVHKTRRRRLSPEDQQAAQVAWARFEKMRAGSN